MGMGVGATPTVREGGGKSVGLRNGAGGGR
jgi:hypothetical protein